MGLIDWSKAREDDSRMQHELGISSTLAQEIRQVRYLFERAPHEPMPEAWLERHQLVTDARGYEQVLLHRRFRDMILDHLENYARLVSLQDAKREEDHE